MSATAAPITREYIKELMVNQDKLRKEIHGNPARLAEINAFLQSPEYAAQAPELVSEAADPEVAVVAEPTPEEAAALAAQADADKILAEKEAAETSRKTEESEAYKAAGITFRHDAAGNVIKIIKEYQATDDVGNPIGNLTHLEARNWAEMALKEREAQVQITRAFNRLKNQKTTFKKSIETVVPIPEVPLMTEKDRIQAALDLNSDDETVVVKADRKLRADQILRDQRQQAINAEDTRRRMASDEFKTIHLNDFNPCQANAKLISDYIAANNLVWTVDNLELAFAATGPQQVPFKAPDVEETVPAARTNSPVAVPQVTVADPEIQPAAAAVVEVPAALPVAANPAPPAARPGVNAGIVPGQMSAVRPVAKPAGLTMKEIHGWTAEQMRKERKNPARKAEIDRVIIAYNKAKSTVG